MPSILLATQRTMGFRLRPESERNGYLAQRGAFLLGLARAGGGGLVHTP